MTDTMRNRIAAIIAPYAFSHPERHGMLSDGWASVDREAALRKVDEIISVLESPSEGMVHAGASSVDHPSVFMGGPSVHGIKTAGRAWRAMIAAIRKGA